MGKTGKRNLDHIVLAVHDLDKAMRAIERKLGVKPIFGGYHKTFGTKNALVNLDQGVYLELLAADNSNTKIQPPRWMGVDGNEENKISRWAVKSEQLDYDSVILSTYDPKMGNILNGSRNTATGSLLKWQLIIPLPEPEVEIVPFIIDWSQSETHPHDELPDMGCSLVELYGMHPNPDQFREIFEKLEFKFRIEKADKIALRAVLKCPRGIIEI